MDWVDWAFVYNALILLTLLLAAREAHLQDNLYFLLLIQNMVR